MSGINPQVDGLVQVLDAGLPAVDRRDRRYSGRSPLRYASDEVRGDLKDFGVNLCRVAVDAVAERMRIKRIETTVRGADFSDQISAVWQRSQMDQLLQPLVVDVLALGSAYLMVWSDERGNPTITPESARNVAVSRHPVSGEVTGAVKRWQSLDASGAVTSEHVIHYGPAKIMHYTRKGVGDWSGREHDNPLGVVPVVPLINTQRVGDTSGYSVIDDLGHLVDALSKILADMLVASEDTARPRRWASGVDLDEPDDELDGFTADGHGEPVAPRPTAVSPFESGNRMFTVESPDAKFGQLPGADLKGYQTAVDLVLQQIMAVSALPAHMVGVTSSNPASADGIRAAEASLTSRAESRIKVVGLGIERALAIVGAIVSGAPAHEVVTRISWASPATKSAAQEADAVSKLHALGIITTAEAREMIGIDQA